MTKVGRNDPCPCGSGKKYKKCCELKIQRGPKQFKASLLSGKNLSLSQTVLANGAQHKKDFDKATAKKDRASHENATEQQ